VKHVSVNSFFSHQRDRSVKSNLYTTQNRRVRSTLNIPLLRTASVTGGLWFLIAAFPLLSSSPRVELKRVPDDGIQPQTAVDQDGTVHLVYFKGDPAEGDLFYARSKDGASFSNPIRVNSVSGTAVALGNIRGARIAVGRRGCVYIVWNGSRKTGDPVAGRNPMLYTRLNEASTAFEPERNLIHNAYGLDGGGGVAADQQGRVYVFWHAPIPGKKGEEFRRVWMTRSEDDGKTFPPERVAWDEPTGACGCCSLNAYAGPAGTVYVLFRSAQEKVHRDMYLLESKDYGATFRGSEISKWNVGYCVMSSEAFAGGANGIFAAWETEKQVHLGSIKPSTGSASDSTVSNAGTNAKYPSLSINQDGFLLVSWTERMSYKLSGSIHWQVFDRKGQSLGEASGGDRVTASSLAAAYPQKNGSFTIIY
jgi:hypothetical protein